jgi:hypothetical protein
LLFFTVEQSMLEGRPLPTIKKLVAQWVVNLLALEAFIEREGVFPGRSKKLGPVSDPKELRHLIDWVDGQRRAPADTRCTYQLERLKLVPHYIDSSNKGAWQLTYEEYKQFLAAHGGPPCSRSDDRAEHLLYGWASRQRSRRTHFGIRPERAELLEALSIWTW